jgi:hypothetical protein
MSQVWKTSPLTGTGLLVELALADFATDEGIAWPAVGTIAAKARCSEEWVHQVIRKMRASGRLEIEQQGGGRNKSNVYRLRPLVGVNPELNTPFSSKQTLKSVEKRVKSVGKTLKHALPDPSVDPSIDPSTTTAGQSLSSYLCKKWEALCGIGSINSILAQSFKDAEDEDYPIECVDHSFQAAAENNVRKWSYVLSILKDHKTKGDCYAGRPGADNGSQRGGRSPALVGLTAHESAVIDQLGITKPREFYVD